MRHQFLNTHKQRPLFRFKLFLVLPDLARHITIEAHCYILFIRLPGRLVYVLIAEA